MKIAAGVFVILISSTVQAFSSLPTFSVPTIISSLSNLHIMKDSSLSVEEKKARYVLGSGHSSSDTKLCSNAAADLENDVSSSLNDKRRRRRVVGKFQSDVYNKPIVFVGCSGQGNEISRLASEFSIVVDGSHAAMDDILTQMNKKTLGKSHGILLDFSSTENTNKSLKMLQSLYEQDFLIIYVNVHPEASHMEESTVNVKKEFEHAFIQYSDYELCIKDEGLEEDSDSWETMQWQLHRLLARAFLPLATPGSKEPSYNTAHLTMGQNAFFLSLSFPDIADAAPYIEAMCQDVDSMEFRVDLLSCRDDRFELLYSLQKLREMCRPHATRAPVLPYLGEVIDDSIPVVYTVRTAHQAGTYPDDEEGIAKMFELLKLGLRGGTEVLDVESAWDEKMTNEILSMVEDRYASQILGSHHVVGKKISDEEAIGYFTKCALDGRAHGAKVVLSIDDEKDDDQAWRCAKASQNIAAEDGKPIIPHISLILGDVGQYSRILNSRFTPVTHESLPFVAAPGQLTASEIMATRLIMGQVPPKKYGILGHNISYSVSPAMQGSAFAATKLPHSYCLIDMEDVNEFTNSDLWNDPAFGGCSVTIPHKQAIIPHLDQLTDAAQTIGAVNTVIVKKEEGEIKRTLIGDNTDWKGIYNPLNRKLCSVPSNEGKTSVALILGGGGTARAAAYAAKELGLELIYFNRTPEKVKDLADIFGGKVVLTLENDGSSESLKSLLDSMNGEVRIVISTLPAAAEFQLPSWFIESSSDSDRKPIIFDVNYKPFWTKLLEQANSFGFPLVRGSDMLWEQGVGQFELWTGRTAPYKVMKEVVLKNCMPEEK
jgi:pentafunctional AROM polypeptide